MNKKKLYIISPPVIENLSFFLSHIEEICDRFGFNIFALQLRIKRYNPQIVDIAVRTYEVCHKYNVNFIINDYADLALFLHQQGLCDGVHLGQDNIPHSKLHRHISSTNMIIGVSCYDSIDLAKQAVKLCANYVSFGAFFQSHTKTNPKGQPKVKILEQWFKISTLPTVAIGGINSNNCDVFAKFPQVIIACCNYIWSDPIGPANAVKNIINKVS